MGKLDHLKIKRCPAAFAPFARNFNDQVDLLASIQGGPGVDVQIASSPRKISGKPNEPKPKEQPRGKILFTMRPSALNGIGVSGNSSGGSGNVNVVTSDGTLALIDGINVTGSSAYPDSLQAGTFYATVTTGGVFRAVQLAVSNGASGLVVTADGTGLRVNYADLSHDISVKTFTGCNSGNVADYLVIASDFF
ncbi:MAG TPA: hypothetical protein VHN11_21155 [Xanthobacteraceae bacterium]|jgi:hypothetical protein|nr:hypothetical protein [Xanthobacteraceae bacterium]